MSELWAFYSENSVKLADQVVRHLNLTLLSVLLACTLSIPLGILIARKAKLSGPVLNITGILQTIPSIALLGFLIPVLGIGIKPAVFALFLYSLLPIVRNVYTGIRGIDAKITEAARAMGMSEKQVLFKVELPLALPTIFAGIRTATVINVGVATLAAYIAAGGLGEFIFGGIALNNSTMILAGALPAALLAIILDFLLGKLQHIRIRKNNKSGLAVLAIVSLLLTLSAFTGKPNTLLRAGFAPEFTGRRDGLPAVRKTYDLHISHLILGPALMYKAIHENYVDVISGYSTDGRIQAYDLRVLEDDKKCFPPYEAAWLMRGDLFKEFPELKGVLEKLSGSINDSLMTHLNYRVDHQKESVQAVARDFLEKQGMYRPAGTSSQTIIMGSKIFTEQYLLTEIYKQLIEGHTNLAVETKKGLGGTKICLDALKAGEIDLYPEYSGTALQLILSYKGPALHSRQEVYEWVSRNVQSRLNLLFSAPIGFNNTYALMMREKQADALGIRTVSELKTYLESGEESPVK